MRPDGSTDYSPQVVGDGAVLLADDVDAEFGGEAIDGRFIGSGESPDDRIGADLSCMCAQHVRAIELRIEAD